MKRRFATPTLVLLLANLFGCGYGATAQEKVAPGFRVPTAMHKLQNGLRVVVSEDHSAPTFGVCVAYGIGFRLEPKGRTGFAHLFEHMMFEGTPVAPKGVFDQVIEGGGGNNNGDTRYDFTEYIEAVPISSLNQILWLEADRMKTLDLVRVMVCRDLVRPRSPPLKNHASDMRAPCRVWVSNLN